MGQVGLEWDANYATDYTIQVPTDNTNWPTVYAASGENGSNDTLAFLQITARYVKLETTDWSNNSLRNWHQEIEI